MMEETTTSTLKSLDVNSKRLYRKHKDPPNDFTTNHSNKDSSTTNPMDWHRLLLTRLKPHVTGKYRITRKDDYQVDPYSSTSLEQSSVTLQSYTDDSTIIDNHQIVITEADATKQYGSLFDNPVRRDSRFVKNSTVNRTDDHMTSLKRRVRKQQMRHTQQRPSILDESTFQLPSPSNLFMISYPEQAISPRRYRPRRSTCLVTLPPLIDKTRPTPAASVPKEIHGIKWSLYGY